MRPGGLPMAEHVKGKLSVECQSSDTIEIQTETGRSIAFVGDDDDRVDNARRLVACWNALDGIATEDIEAHKFNWDDIDW